MSDIVTCKITGMDEIQKALEALPAKLAKRIEKKALSDASSILVDKLVANAPDDSGLLREHFGVKLTTKGFSKYGALAVRAFVGGVSGNYYPPAAFHKKLKQAMKVKWNATINTAIHFLEFGSSKEPKRPFMSQSWDSVKDQVLAKIVSNLKEALGL